VISIIAEIRKLLKETNPTAYDHILSISRCLLSEHPVLNGEADHGIDAFTGRSLIFVLTNEIQ
jgi:hypothetical protein